MHRRRHRGLSTVGGPFSRLSPPPRPPEDPDLFLEPTQRFLLLAAEGPALGDAASPRVVLESNLEDTDVCSDVLRPQKRCHTSVRGHLQDVATPCPDPDVREPKKRCFGPQTTPDPDVGRKMAIPNVQPQNHTVNPKMLANPDVKHLEGSNPILDIESNTGVRVPPETALFNPNRHRPATKVSSNLDVEERGPDPDVGRPESHRTAPRDPDVKTETTDRDVEGRRALLVESDTDVEEDISNPVAEPPKTHRATQNVPRNPHLEMESPNPPAEGPRNKHWTLVVDSDTDVEENEVNPDAGHPKIHRIMCRDPDVEGEAPNASVKEPRNKHWSLEVDSDTDIEEDRSQAALRPKSHKTPQNTRKDPTVVMETPNPDVGGLRRGSVACNGDSDTDVEDLDALPNVGAPKTRGTTPEVMGTVAKMAAAPDADPQGRPRTNADPDVRVSFPNPDVGALKAECPLLDVGSDTDVEDNGVVPDVRTVQGCQGASGDPDVAVTSPNPDVSPPASTWESSDTDVEVLPPTPDVRGLRSRIRFQNHPHPDVAGPTTGRNTDVKETARKRRKLSPKRQGFLPKSECDKGVARMLLKDHDLAPNPAVEAPNPGVGAKQCDGETPVRGKDAAVPADVSVPKSSRLTPNLSDAADTDGGPRSAGATGAAVTESDTEGWSPDPGPCLVSDSEDDKLPWRPALGDAASPRVVLESNLEDTDVCSDVLRPPKRCHTSVRGHLQDVATPCPDPDVREPKKRCFGPQTTPDPDVGRKMAIPNVQPQNHTVNPKMLANPDVKHLEGSNPILDIESNTGVRVPPETALFNPNRHRPATKVSSNLDVEERGPDPDVGRPESHRTAPRDPDVKTETTDRDVEGRRALLVESDTDVEEDISNPVAEPPKTHRATQNVPRNPHLEMESPNPPAEGPRNKHWTLVVDSDTDVEENEVNPDAGHPKIHRIMCRDPDVEGEAPNASVKEPRNKHWSLEVDSDTDIEEDRSQAALRPKSHKTPQNTRKDPTVVMETPNPDVGGLRRGSVACNGDSDTDVEDLDTLPNVGAPKTRGTTPEVMGTVAKMAAAPDADPQGRPRTNADPDVRVSFPNPDVGALKAECPLLDVGSDTDVEDNGVVPDVRTVQGCQGASGDPDVAVTSPNPDVSPPASTWESSDTDVEVLPPTPDVRGLRSRIRFQNHPHPDVAGPTTGRNTDVKETARKRRKLSPKRQGFPPKSECDKGVAGMLPKDHDLAPNPAVEAPNPGVGAKRRDGETPVRGKDAAVPADVSVPKSSRLTPNLSEAADTDGGPRSAGATGAAVAESDTEGWSPDPGPCLVSDSEDDKLPWRPALGDAASPRVVLESDMEDTDVCPDVEERGPDPDVGRPESHRTAPRDPDVKTETTGRDVEGRRALLVESDTDVEEDISNPVAEPPKTHRATQNVPRNPHLEMESPNPPAEGPRNKHWTLVVDSDTDVEENEVNPDAGHPKIHRIMCRDPDVEGEAPNASVKEPRNKHWSLEVDSDTDIEEDRSQAALRPKSHKTPQNTRKDPTVVMETPNPDVGGLRRGSVACNGDSDTDVEDLDALPNVGAPKTRGTTPEVMGTVAKMAAAPDADPQGRPRTNADPDVRVSFPNPDVGALKAECPLLDVGSDTDVEDNGVVPDVRTVQGCQGASGDKDVAVTSPNPDVSPPASTWESSDTDVEVLPPTPDVRGLRSRIRFQNHPHPDVAGPTTGRNTDVKETARKRRKFSPKRQGFPPKSESVAGMLPKDHDLAPNPAVEAPNPGVGAKRRDGETPVRGKDAAVPADVSVPKSSRLTPDLSDAADTDGGPRSAGATGAAVTESDTEEDPDVFLEPTQSFLPPAAEGTALGWDPEQPTQPFCPPEEEEEEEDDQPPPKPPREPPAACVPPAEPVTVTPAQEGTGTEAAPSEDVGEGPRRSQRLARSRGGGASGEGGASRVRGGASPVTAPVRRSPRLQACPPLLELPAMRGRGRGRVEPRPPTKPRPCRAGPGPSQRQAQEKESELPEVTGPQLRPRGGPGSVPPKVLFTGVAASPEMEVALRTLGGSMATSVFDCTHLVTDRVRRTVKFLCAVARGVPIVTPEWLHKSTLSGHVLVPDPFLVRDSQQECHFGFSLAEALRRARHHPLLQGYEVHVTPSVHPEPELMRDIITCSGGTFLPTMPHTYGPRRLVISCEADKGCWAPALGARLPLVSAELLLTGLLRQRLQLQPFLLLPATPPRSHGTPPNPLKVSTVPPGVLCHPPEDPQGIPGSPRESAKVSGRSSRNRRPPRETSRGNRRRPAAPPAPQ